MKVVFPFTPVDEALAVTLSAWIKELGPNKGHSVLLVRDIRCHPNNDQAIRSNLGGVFDSIEEIIIKDRVDGWPLAPNIMFRYAAKQIEFTTAEPWLWMEADVVPLKEGWVQALAEEYDAEPRRPFLGDFVSVPNVEPHMSGIAVYPGRISEHAGITTMAQEYAWDVFGAHQIVPKMKQTQLIKHRWKFPRLNNHSEVDNLLGQLGNAVLFHQDKTGSLIGFLRERRALRGDTGRVSRLPEQRNSNPESGSSPAPLTDIFIKTYSKDYQWLHYCLKSIQKFTQGFRQTLVLNPGELESRVLFSDGTTLPDPDPILKTVTVTEYGDDTYLSQQVFKLYADTFSDADYFCMMDSDTIFTRPVSPNVYFRNWKPIWMITPIDQAHPDQQHAWRKVMQKFLGKEPEFEFMRRHPFVVPRWALASIRAFCKQAHGMELKDYVMQQPYREFSEFNCIGFYLYEFHRDKFEWINTSLVEEKDWPVLTVDQQWSHNPIPTERWDAILSGGAAAHSRASAIESDNAGCKRSDTPAQENGETSMADIRRYAQVLARYADRDGFALGRVRKELVAAGVIKPQKKPKKR